MERGRRSRDKFANERPRLDERRTADERSRSRSKERKLVSKEVERLARRVVKAEFKSRDGKVWNQVRSVGSFPKPHN